MTEKSILAIDDDPTILVIIKEILTKHGYAPSIVESGEAGLKELEDNTFDAIILDIKMPSMDGDEVLKTIRNTEETKNIPVMMLTGQNSITETSEFLEAGANDYMVKPFTPEALVTRLKVMLNK